MRVGRRRLRRGNLAQQQYKGRRDDKGDHYRPKRIAGITMRAIQQKILHSVVAGVRREAMSLRWALVRMLRIAPHTAMPTAPPMLRIMLKRSLAYLSRAIGRPPRPNVTDGRLNAVVDFDLFQADLERAVPRSDRSKVAGHRLIMC